jgi:flagellar basal body-associated protein FliL
MKKIVLLFVFVVVGVAAGGTGGIFLKPAEDKTAAAAPDKGVKAEEKKDKEDKAKKDSHGDEKGATKDQEFVKLNNQFVVPVVEHGRVQSLVILSLSLEVKPGSRERIYEMEPRIRDTLLSVLFDHANSGGFSGSFTDTHAMAGLRSGMRSASTTLMGEDVKDVLVLDIVRQDVN